MKKYVRSAVSTAPQGQMTRMHNHSMSISDLHTQPNISDLEHTRFKAAATPHSPLNTLISSLDVPLVQKERNWLKATVSEL